MLIRSSLWPLGSSLRRQASGCMAIAANANANGRGRGLLAGSHHLRALTMTTTCLISGVRKESVAGGVAPLQIFCAFSNRVSASHDLCRRACRRRSSSSSSSSGQKRGVPPLPAQDPPSSERIFVHISPSGDFWLGEAIFAAKHLSSDYLRSVPLPAGSDAGAVEGLLGRRTTSQMQAIYDSGELPRDVMPRPRP